jgi:hypothetical protein
MRIKWVSDSGGHEMEIHLSAEDAALLDEQRGDIPIEEYVHILIRAVLLTKLPANNGDGDGARALTELLKNKEWVSEFLQILKSRNLEGDGRAPK